jgi:hypothetical protein
VGSAHTRLNPTYALSGITGTSPVMTGVVCGHIPQIVL